MSGFDAFLGNPPWISYAGRAAQPLPDELRQYYGTFFEAFEGYRNLQGLFIERTARLLRDRGRLGLVVPSSMSEQDGYAPTRLAHDKRCFCDDELPDVGEDAFRGVFQPCMGLHSTRRAEVLDVKEASRWPIERPDLDAESRGVMGHMTSFAALPAHLFGERGLQTTGDDVAHFTSDRDPVHTIPFRAGGDISAFRRGAPSLHADHKWFGGRLRAATEWKQVRILIRQTARIPIAALSDGEAFRNSILAGFADDTFCAEFLVAYLNATPIRWLHYSRHRDARQGMPQMKIGHLRTIPAPPRPELMSPLAEIGAALSKKNNGIEPSAQARIDAIVGDMFELPSAVRLRMQSWAEELR
jgi:hypothetical protein